jgi:hypothetical protein
MNVAYLNLLFWGASLGGEHYYVSLITKTPYRAIRLNQKLTQKMAKYLNQKDGFTDMYKTGELTERFNSPKEAVKAALKECNRANCDVEIILSGDGGWASVTECLWSKDKNVQKRINKLYKEAEKIKFYSEIDDKRMEEIDKEFDYIIGATK